MSEAKLSSISQLIDLLTNQPIAYSGQTSAPPVVSIISSFYNAHRYFEQTFDSVINQTLQNFEWLIVDDCSTDEPAVALFDTLEERSDKIKTFRHTHNRGPAAGRNTAVSYATGKYLFFIDLDDLIDPTYIEKCVVFLELHPEFSFVNSRAAAFEAQHYWWNHGFEKAPLFIEQNWVTIMLMYRKSDFDALGGFDEDLHSFKIFYEDWERWLRALAAGQKGWTIPEFLHFYRRTNSGGLSSSQRNVENEKIVTRRLQQKYAKQFKESPPPIPLWREPLTPYDVRNFRQRLEINNVLDNEQFAGKRILFLFPFMNVGGADKFNLDLLRLLKDRNYQLTVATTLQSEHTWHEFFYKITPDIFHLPNYTHETEWLPFLRYLIESRRIDIVFISNSYAAYYMLPLLRAEYKNVAFVDYVHACDPGWRVDGYPRLSRQFSDFLDAQMLTSRHLAEYNEQIEPNTKDKFSVCTINIEPKEWQFDETARNQLRQFHNISNETVLLIFPARLTAQKRPGFFVQIIKELVECSLPVKAIILGKGELLEPTQKLIEESNLENFFTIIPPVTPDEMKRYYSAADILLLPTEYEGISLAIYEAMAMQLPVVASDVGGQSELVVDGTGYLVEKGAGDDIEIEDYIKTLLPLISDSKLRKTIGTAARQRVEEFFTLEVMGDCVEKVFAQAVSHRKSQAREIINKFAAEELLAVALECSRIERGWAYLNALLTQSDPDSLQQNSELTYEQIKIERDLLLHQKKSMEASKFWKIRQRWFQLKYKIGLSKYES